MRKLALLFVALLLMSGCGLFESEPPNRTTEIQVHRFAPVRVSGSPGQPMRAIEVMARVTVRNTTPDPIWIIGGTDWWLRTQDGRVFSSRPQSGKLNVSQCSRDIVTPGGAVGCDVFFYFGDWRTDAEVLPARLSYSEPFGNSSGRVDFDAYTEW